MEGCNGIGRQVAQLLVAAGETVLDVPAKLSATVRPRGVAGRTWRRLAAELLADIVRLDRLSRTE